MNTSDGATRSGLNSTAATGVDWLRLTAWAIGLEICVSFWAWVAFVAERLA